MSAAIFNKDDLSDFSFKIVINRPTSLRVNHLDKSDYSNR